MNQNLKLISIWKASHWDSLWNRGKRQLGNHLLWNTLALVLQISDESTLFDLGIHQKPDYKPVYKHVHAAETSTRDIYLGAHAGSSLATLSRALISFSCKIQKCQVKIMSNRTIIRKKPPSGKMELSHLATKGSAGVQRSAESIASPLISDFTRPVPESKKRSHRGLTPSRN